MGHDCSADETIWDDAYALDRAHVFHSWHAQRNLHPTEVVTGHGVWLNYADGREMLDFTSQQVNVNIGYQHPAVVEGIKQQAELLATIGPDYANLARGRAASAVARRAPQGFDKVFFTNAGADANENAMRAARLVSGRDKILSSYRCYHGNTGAAISATGDWRRKPNDYARGHVHFFTPYLYRSEFFATTQEEECERALTHLEHVIQFEGPDTIAAVLLESIPGTAGIIIPPKDYFKGVREITRKYGILMITDEVMAGFGRTGFWFALDDYDYTPDIITFAKGVAGGFPMGGMIAFGQQLSDLFTPGSHGSTFAGNPLGAAAALATLGVIEHDDLLANAQARGRQLREGIMATGNPLFKSTRGAGLLDAVELAHPCAHAAMNWMLEHGLIVNAVAPNALRIAPPLIVSAQDVNAAVSIMAGVPADLADD